MKTVLYVEDDLTDRELMMIAVAHGKPRFELRLQWDYKMIRDYIRSRGLFNHPKYFPPPDLVLLDYSLGTFKSTELLYWIRTQPETQALPVVMFSGNTEGHIVAESYELGANYFIAKPAQMAERLKLVNSLDACLRAMPPSFENLSELAVCPALSRRSITRELRAA
jgi:two-component system response regulator